jgi:hypothetical protein
VAEMGETRNVHRILHRSLFGNIHLEDREDDGMIILGGALEK